jgi:PTS system galactitol-specific IIC component
VTLAIGFYVANALAPLFTQAAVASGFKLPENAAQITSIVDGFLWVPYVFVEAVQSAGIAGLIILAVLVTVGFWIFRRSTARWERVAGATAEEMA